MWTGEKGSKLKPWVLVGNLVYFLNPTYFAVVEGQGINKFSVIWLDTICSLPDSCQNLPQPGTSHSNLSCKPIDRHMPILQVPIPAAGRMPTYAPGHEIMVLDPISDGPKSNKSTQLQ